MKMKNNFWHSSPRLSQLLMVFVSFVLASCAQLDPMGSQFQKLNQAANMRDSGDMLRVHENPAFPEESRDGKTLDEGEEDYPNPTPEDYEKIKASQPVYNPKARRTLRPAGGRGEGDITLNFEGADMREVIKFIMTDTLNLNYILSPEVQGQVTLQTSRPITSADLLPLLEDLLKMNGSVMIREGDNYRIMPQVRAHRGQLSPKTGRMRQTGVGYEVRVFPLRYLSALEAQQMLEPFLPDGSLIRVDAARNMLIIGGTQSELANIQDTLEIFDVDWLKGMSIGLFRLKNISVEEIMPELESLFGETATTPLAGLFRFIPMDRMNAVMVLTPQPGYLDEAKRWVERLDVTEGSAVERLYVYRVQYTDAEELADVLSSVFDGSSSSSGKTRSASVAEGLKEGSAASSDTKPAKAVAKPRKKSKEGSTASGIEVSIVADVRNNSLLVRATPDNYDAVLQAIKQLDVPKRQVLLDAVIAEVSLTGTLQYGLRWWFTNNMPDNYSGAGAIGSITSGNPNLPNGKEALRPVNFANQGAGFSYSLVNAGGVLKAQLDLLANQGLVRVLSAPSLMVLDNESASMNVGTSISVLTGSTTSDRTSTSYDYLETGVSLEVTPRINASGAVQLDISQEVSRPGTATGGANPPIDKSTISTIISAQDGETVVLGGLIQENDTSGRSGVPLLSSIPVVGSLFGATNMNNSRKELILLITPRVAHGRQDTLRISKEFRDRMRVIDLSHQLRSHQRDEQRAL